MFGGALRTFMEHAPKVETLQEIERSTIKTSSPYLKPASLEDSFDFENLDDSIPPAAPNGACLIDWVCGACSTIEDIIA